MGVPLEATTGTAFKLELRYTDPDKLPVDLSSGYAARLVIKESKDAAASILDKTDSDAEITLSSGAGETANVTVFVGKTTTAAWPIKRDAVYQLQVWPSATPEDVTLLLKGRLEITQGII